MRDEIFCLYPYITENNLEHKQNYMYSKYAGEGFLRAYIQTRKVNGWAQDYLAENLEPVEGSVVYQEFVWICQCLDRAISSHAAFARLKGYVKSFEVRKRLYTAYQGWEPVQDASFEEYESYLLFADALLQAYGLTKNLKYFSCLLKLDDTLLSIQDKLNTNQKSHLQKISNQELAYFFEMLQANGIKLEESR